MTANTKLKERAKERLPHRFKNQRTGSKPKVTTGGSGRDGGGSGIHIEKNLPKEFVNALKQAGHWDEPAKKKAAIADFLANKKAKG